MRTVECVQPPRRTRGCKPPGLSWAQMLDVVERLRRKEENVTQAAQRLGVPLSTLHYHLKYGRAFRGLPTVDTRKRTRLTLAQVLDARARIRGGEKFVSLAAELGVPLATLHRSLRGRTKAHAAAKMEESLRRTVITREQMAEAARRVQAGESAASAARALGVNATTLRDALRGRVAALADYAVRKTT